MNTLFIGKNFVELETVASTNTFALELLGSGPAEGTVVLARHQTAGRGQQGSMWLAQPGLNLTFSVVLYPDFLAVKELFLLNKMIACALQAAVADLLPGALVQIKWPNDLLVNGSKVAGILIETSLESQRIRSAVVGIGVNVNQTEFDPLVHGKATSLALVTGLEWDARAVLWKVLERLEGGYLMVRAGRKAEIERDYLRHLYAYQEDSLVEVDGKQTVAHIVGVDGDGRLAVQQGGKLYFYAVKEIKLCL